MRLRLTYANVTATAALFVVMGGSAFAAITISGANVANNSLTGTDVKGASLSVADLSLAQKGQKVVVWTQPAPSSLKAQRGDDFVLSSALIQLG